MPKKTPLIYQKPHKLPIIVVISFVILLLSLTFIVKTEDEYNVSALIVCQEKCFLNTTLYYEEILPPIEYAVIEGERYKVSSINYQPPYLDENSMLITQSVEIALQDSQNFANNRLVNVKLLGNEQRTIEKILKILF